MTLNLWCLSYRHGGNDMSSLTFFNNTNSDFLDRFFGFEDFAPPLVRTRETKDLYKPTVKNLEDKYEISLIAPGLDKKDFNITLEQNQIKISYDVSEKENTYCYATKYSKSYVVPVDCDVEKISASYKNGVMILTLPKADSAKPRTIQIK